MSNSSHLRELGEAFLAGLVKPSVAGSVGSLLFALGGLAVLAVVINERAISRLPPDALIYSQSDWGGHATVEALRYKYAPHDELGLVITGSSFVIESINDPWVIDQQLAEQGVKVDYAFLATDAQLLQETAMMLDQLPPDHPVVAVVGVGPLQMMHGPEKLQEMLKYQRFALDSTALDDEIKRAQLPPRLHTDYYFLNNVYFYVFWLSMAYRLLLQSPQLNTHYTTTAADYPPWTEQRWQELEPTLAKRVKPEYIDYAFEVLERLLQRFEKRGNVHVVLMDLPLHPRMQRMIGPEIMQQYQTRMKALSAQYSAPFWHLADEARIEPADFHDHGHLGNSAARQRFQELLVRRLADWIKQLPRTTKEN